jgi:hypothetical protein
MWNGVDMELYMRSHDPECIHTVIQFLELFKWDQNALEALQYLADEKYILGSTAYARDIKLRQKKIRQDFTEPKSLVLVIDQCDKCGGLLRAGRLAACESKETGRTGIIECDDCTYYAEIFLKNGEYIKVEGE